MPGLFDGRRLDEQTSYLGVKDARGVSIEVEDVTEIGGGGINFFDAACCFAFRRREPPREGIASIACTGKK